MDTGPQKGANINRYTRNIVKRASRMLTGETDLETLGRTLASVIEKAALNPVTNQESLRMLTKKLESILVEVDGEITRHNCESQLGRMCHQYHKDAWVDKTITDMLSDDDPLKQTLLNIISKGENYQYDRQPKSTEQIPG